MHEYAVSESLVELVLAESRKAGLSHVCKIVIELGELSTYKAEPLEFYFDILKTSFPDLQDAVLEIEEVSAKLHCQQCGVESQIEDPWLIVCPACQSAEVQILTGKDLLLKQLVGDRENGRARC